MNSVFDKLTVLVVVTIAFLDGLLIAEHWREESPSSTAAVAITLENSLEQKSSSISTESAKNVEDQEEKLIIPPFIVQTPFGVWEEPWTDSAEEASVLMAYLGVTGQVANSQDELAAELLRIIAWEEAQFGTAKETDALQTLRILNEFYGSDAKLSYELSPEALQGYLDQGMLLLIPVNGQILANRHYGNPAPGHHMILVYDYEDSTLLSHDPGTIRGESYPYAQEKLLDAIQDLNGEKRIILIAP